MPMDLQFDAGFYFTVFLELHRRAEKVLTAVAPPPQWATWTMPWVWAPHGLHHA
jgi:hypothetical protein